MSVLASLHLLVATVTAQPHRVARYMGRRRHPLKVIEAPHDEMSSDVDRYVTLQGHVAGQ